MNTHPHDSRAAQIHHLKAILAGTKKHFPTGTLHFGNVTMTVNELVALLQRRIDTLTTVVAAQQKIKDAVKAKRASVAKADPLIRAYHRFLHATYGSSARALADFDLVPHKPRRKATGKEIVAKATKARATRRRRPARVTR